MVVDNGTKHLSDIINFLRSRKSLIVRVDPFKCNLKKLNPKSIDGIILTGGSTRFVKDKRNFNFRIINMFRNKPIIGICLGNEFLIEYYQGTLYKMRWRAQGYSYINITKSNRLVNGKKRISVYKGHSYAGGILPDCFEHLAWSTDCENEMIEHKKRPHFGTQFHPEMNSEGHKMLDNFLKLCRAG
jgi:GMP synthase-like glutamine amidotransferase